MSRKIGDGRNFWRPGNEDLPMLVELLYAQREDQAWLMMAEQPACAIADFPYDHPALQEETIIALPDCDDPEYWNCALILCRHWNKPRH
jgi:hypothetical protein